MQSTKPIGKLSLLSVIALAQLLWLFQGCGFARDTAHYFLLPNGDTLLAKRISFYSSRYQPVFEPYKGYAVKYDDKYFDEVVLISENQRAIESNETFTDDQIQSFLNSKVTKLRLQYVQADYAKNRDLEFEDYISRSYQFATKDGSNGNFVFSVDGRVICIVEYHNKVIKNYVVYLFSNITPESQGR